MKKSNDNLTPEQSLADLEEELKWVCSDGKSLTDYDRERIEVLKKALKVLEIIKKKGQYQAMLDNYAIYKNKSSLDSLRHCNALTDEEFEIIKEFFGNE